MEDESTLEKIEVHTAILDELVEQIRVKDQAPAPQRAPVVFDEPERLPLWGHWY